MKKIILLTVSFLVCLNLSTPVYAYLDPGTGGVLLQGIFAGFASVLALVKIYWRRIKLFFNRFRQKVQQNDDQKV